MEYSHTELTEQIYEFPIPERPADDVGLTMGVDGPEGRHQIWYPHDSYLGVVVTAATDEDVSQLHRDTVALDRMGQRGFKPVLDHVGIRTQVYREDNTQIAARTQPPTAYFCNAVNTLLHGVGNERDPALLKPVDRSTPLTTDERLKEWQRGIFGIATEGMQATRDISIGVAALFLTGHMMDCYRIGAGDALADGSGREARIFDAIATGYTQLDFVRLFLDDTPIRNRTFEVMWNRLRAWNEREFGEMPTRYLMPEIRGQIRYVNERAKAMNRSSMNARD